MKININKLLYADTDFTEINENYLQKKIESKFVDSWNLPYKGDKKKWINENYTHGALSRLLGRNISVLFHKLKADKRKYIYNINELIKMHIDVTNVNGILVNNLGYNDTRPLNSYYTNIDNIICKYPKKEIKRKRKEFKTELQYIADEYFNLESDIKIQRRLLFEEGRLVSNVNRFLSNKIDKLNSIKNEYNKFYNFLHNRKVSDKSYKKGMQKTVKTNRKMLNKKSRRVENKAIIFDKYKTRVSNSTFPSL